MLPTVMNQTRQPIYVIGASAVYEGRGRAAHLVWVESRFLGQCVREASLSIYRTSAVTEHRIQRGQVVTVFGRSPHTTMLLDRVSRLFPKSKKLEKDGTSSNLVVEAQTAGGRINHYWPSKGAHPVSRC
jgi:hypothetical protein